MIPNLGVDVDELDLFDLQQFNQKISVAFGDQQFTYWKKDRFTFAPVGLQFNSIAKFGKQPVRFLIGPQYNIKNEFGSRKWTITSGFALILQ